MKSALTPTAPLGTRLHGSSGDARAVLSRHGRSFHFASKLLDPETALRSARLYRFCRYVDDIADEATDRESALQRLDAITAMLRRGEASDPVVADFLALARSCQISVAPALELVQGVRSDLGNVRFADERDLLRYCYRVAGTVGLMMCGVLDVRDPRALPFAIDLGIAMQLTNIARDVGEDAANGRRYLPASMLGDVDPTAIGQPDTNLEVRLASAVKQLLARAENYYLSGQRGLVFLPARARLGIRVAARVYRRIGKRLRSLRHASWRTRAVVPAWQKLAVAVKAIGTEYFSRLRAKPVAHDPELHRSLTDLYGTNPGSIRD